MATNFQRHKAFGLQRWAHKSKPTFVTHYPATAGRPGVFYAYRAIGTVAAGRMPWTVNNKRIGEARTLRAALSLAEA